MNQEQIAYQLLKETVLDNPYVKITPHPKAAAFLTTPSREILFGGAGGGSKSTTLLTAALQYAHIPQYRALILRRTFKQLSGSDGLMDKAQEWLKGTSAKWHADDKKWTFPSGAVLYFGHMEHESSIYNYQGLAYHFVGWDELTQFTEKMYTYVSFSRSRRTNEALQIPIRVRATANPGGEGHEWVKARFITNPTPDRVFIPSKVWDNPGLDVEEYIKSLEQLDPFTRAQLLYGDWDAQPGGTFFQRDWFTKISPAEVPPNARRIRIWDFAATEPKRGTDPDYTVGTRIAEHKGIYYVEHVIRKRVRPEQVENLVRECAKADGYSTVVCWEQEPGSSGKILSSHIKRNVVPEYRTYAIPATGKKVERARPVSAIAENGNIYVVNANWNKEWFNELEAFPAKEYHDDQVDSLCAGISFMKSTIPVNRTATNVITVKTTPKQLMAGAR